MHEVKGKLIAADFELTLNNDFKTIYSISLTVVRMPISKGDFNSDYRELEDW